MAEPKIPGNPNLPAAFANRIDPVAREIHLRSAAEGMRELLRRQGKPRDEEARARLDKLEQQPRVSMANVLADVAKLRAEVEQLRELVERGRGPRRRTLTAHLASGPVTIHSMDEPQ
jgi:hypothetical protein